MVGKYVESVKSRVAATLPHPDAARARGSHETDHRRGVANTAGCAQTLLQLSDKGERGDHDPIPASIRGSWGGSRPVVRGGPPSPRGAGRPRKGIRGENAGLRRGRYSARRPVRKAD